MDPLVLLILAVSLPFAGLCWYLGWARGGWNPFDYMAKGAFLVTVAILVPALVAVLVLQAGAEGRLQSLGVTPHPSVRHVVGVAAGIGESPIWLFRTEGDAGELLAYYLDPTTRPGWELASHTPALELSLERDGKRLHATVSDGWDGTYLTYQLLGSPANRR